MERNSKELTEFIRFTACLAAGRRGRIVAEPPTQEDAAAALETWRASREQVKHREQAAQDEAEFAEIAALEAALRQHGGE